MSNQNNKPFVAFKAIKAKELTARKDGRCTLIEAAELQRWIRTFPAIGREAVAA